VADGGFGLKWVKAGVKGGPCGWVVEWVVSGWCKVSRSVVEEHTFFISRVPHFSPRFPPAAGAAKYATIFKGLKGALCVCVCVCVSQKHCACVCVHVLAMINEPLAFIFVSVSFRFVSFAPQEIDVC